MEVSAFNSPLETGVRSLGVLAAAHPLAFDLQRLVVFDHLVVHTADLGGPESLHPKVPLRSAEMLVRRGVIERGIMLMVSRGLVEKVVDEQGFSFRASETALAFLDSLETKYMCALKERARWVSNEFGALSDTDIKIVMENIFEKWVEQFHSTDLQSESQL
ncbi:MAG: threonine transporter [Verrucomicrobiae bacterium]|nr:threonine transporter [Verrucomicrobiae bacterium]